MKCFTHDFVAFYVAFETAFISLFGNACKPAAYVHFVLHQTARFNIYPMRAVSIMVTVGLRSTNQIAGNSLLCSEILLKANNNKKVTGTITITRDMIIAVETQ